MKRILIFPKGQLTKESAKADEGTVPDAKTIKGIEADWEKVRK